MRHLHIDQSHIDAPRIAPEQRLIMAIVTRAFLDLRVNGERAGARAYISSDQCEYHCSMLGLDADELRRQAGNVKREKRKPGEHL